MFPSTSSTYTEERIHFECFFHLVFCLCILIIKYILSINKQNLSNLNSQKRRRSPSISRTRRLRQFRSSNRPPVLHPQPASRNLPRPLPASRNLPGYPLPPLEGSVNPQLPTNNLFLAQPTQSKVILLTLANLKFPFM